MVQGELFREEKPEYGSSALENSRRKSFLTHHQVVITLDKVLLVSIALMVAFVLTYSFGVERGKRTVEKQVQALLPSHSEVVSTGVAVREASEHPTEETVLLVGEEDTQEGPGTLKEPLSDPILTTPKLSELTKPLKPSQETKQSLPGADLTKQGKFTVQLVTYDNEKQASQEVSRLNAKGHDSFVIPSGRYYQVCANYFENQSKAQSFLKQFRESGRYPDAYIRPVVR